MKYSQWTFTHFVRNVNYWSRNTTIQIPRHTKFYENVKSLCVKTEVELKLQLNQDMKECYGGQNIRYRRTLHRLVLGNQFPFWYIVTSINVSCRPLFVEKLQYFSNHVELSQKSL